MMIHVALKSQPFGCHRGASRSKLPVRIPGHVVLARFPVTALIRTWGKFGYPCALDADMNESNRLDDEPRDLDLSVFVFTGT